MRDSTLEYRLSIYHANQQAIQVNRIYVTVLYCFDIYVKILYWDFWRRRNTSKVQATDIQKVQFISFIKLPDLGILRLPDNSEDGIGANLIQNKVH